LLRVFLAPASTSQAMFTQQHNFLGQSREQGPTFQAGGMGATSIAPVAATSVHNLSVPPAAQQHLSLSKTAALPGEQQTPPHHHITSNEPYICYMSCRERQTNRRYVCYEFRGFSHRSPCGHLTLVAAPMPCHGEAPQRMLTHTHHVCTILHLFRHGEHPPARQLQEEVEGV